MAAHFFVFDKPLFGGTITPINGFGCQFSINDPGFNISQSSPSTINGVIIVQIQHVDASSQTATIVANTNMAGPPNGQTVKVFAVGCA